MLTDQNRAIAHQLQQQLEAIVADPARCAPYAGLPTVDLKAMLSGMSWTDAWTISDIAVDLGWMAFTGNQHNERWDWTSTWIDRLEKTGQLAAFVVLVKTVNAHGV